MLIVLILVSIISISTTKCPPRCMCAYKKIDCNHSDLRAIPLQLDPNSEVLDFSRNNIDLLEDDSFESNVNIWNILLPSNNIYFIDINTFARLKNLQVLVLSDNSITSINPETFSNNTCLYYLDLRNNTKLVVPETGYFLNIPSVVTLILSDCNIDHLSDEMFVHTPSLKYLHLNNNKLKRFDLTVFKTLQYLGQLDIENNELICDCSIQEVEDWVSEMNICLFGRKCYKNDKSALIYWDDVNMECSRNKFNGQSINSDQRDISKRARPNCSLGSYSFHYPSIKTECKQTIVMATTNSSQVHTNAQFETKVTSTSTRPPNVPTTLLLPEHNITLTTEKESSLISHVLYVIIGTCIVFIVILIIVCILNYAYIQFIQERQRKRDSARIDSLTAVLFKKKNDEEEQTSSRYTAEPMRFNRIRAWDNIRLPQLHQMGYANNRLMSSGYSYIAEGSDPETISEYLYADERFQHGTAAPPRSSEYFCNEQQGYAETNERRSEIEIPFLQPFKQHQNNRSRNENNASFKLIPPSYYAPPIPDD